MRVFGNLLIAAFFLASCNAIFIPAKQKVTIQTSQPKATVYLNGEESEQGVQKLKRSEQYQVIVKSPGYKDLYTALISVKRPTFYPIGVLLDLPTLYGYSYDRMLSYNKAKSFNKVNDLPSNIKLVTRIADEKYIDISNVGVSIANKNKDIAALSIKYSKDISEAVYNAEQKKESKDQKTEAKQAKKKHKKSLSEEESKINYEDTKYSDQLFATLKKTGFIDTVNKVFSDNNNTLVLEAQVKKMLIFNVSANPEFGGYDKAKVFVIWYVKNTYGEILDSISVSEMSGEFVGVRDDFYKTMIGDAIESSYLKLHTNPRFTKFLKQETNFSISDPLLSLTSPSKFVAKKTDAAEASVIVKTKDGHGSGFAITNDGYIITNYHVISSRLAGKVNDVKIITSENQELEGKVIRYNKFRDLALIKVDKKFGTAFKVTDVKSFEKLQDVFTVGAPKSIELGQSISAGIISNERNNNNNTLLQLGMSVNAGNSGGPLFDANGTLHGVVVAKLVGANTEGVSFAVPGYLISQYLNIKYN